MPIYNHLFLCISIAVKIHIHNNVKSRNYEIIMRKKIVHVRMSRRSAYNLKRAFIALPLLLYVHA